MGIQNKVSAILILLLILVMGTIVLVVNAQISSLLNTQVESEIELLHEADARQAETVFHGYEIGSRSSVEMGEMDDFACFASAGNGETHLLS